MNTANSASDWSKLREVFVIFHSTRRFFVIPLVSVFVSGAASAADTDDAAGRTFAFCDKNSDGKLDAAELDGVPVTMRGWLAKHGAKSKAGLARADFVKVYPQMMAELRTKSQVASSTAKPQPTVDPTPKPGPEKTTAPATSSKVPLYASEPPSDEIVETVPASNLPANYQDADIDKDGQIDYFEWRKAKFGSFAKFQEYDLNNDSVLSAQELNAGGVAVGSAGSESSSPTTTPSDGNSPSSSSKTASSSARPSTPSGPSEEYITQVKYYFEIMDKQKGNKNGKLDPPEWNASKRIKPAFEKAGIDISKPMDEKTFIMHYSKVFPEKKKEAPKVRGFQFGRRPAPGGNTGRNGGVRRRRR